jgi:hypothetical protein
MTAKHRKQGHGVRVLALVACASLTSTTHAHPGRGIVVNAANDVFVADAVRSVVWKIDANGHIAAAARELHAHWLSLADDGSILADHLWYRASDQSFPRGLKRITPTGAIETVIEPKVDPHGLDAGAFTALPAGIAIARDSNLHVAFNNTPTPQPDIDLRSLPADAGTATVNALIDLADGSLIALRARTLIHIKDGVASEMTTIPPATAPKGNEQPASLWGLAADDAGLLYVADHEARVVYKLSKNASNTWTPMAIFTSQAPWFPTGVYAKDGAIYVLEHGLEGGDHNLGPRVSIISGDGTARVLATIDHQ